MAELEIEGDELVLRLTPLEKVASVHGDLRAPRSAVRSIEVLDDAHGPADVGLKVGERLPGHSEVAVVWRPGEKLFAVVHHATPRGVRVRFDGYEYDAWIVGSSDPEGLAARLGGSAPS